MMLDSSSHSKPVVGVVIVTYNSAGLIERLAASLRVALGELPHRVVVVDNASSDDTVARVRRANFEVVEMGRNAGYSAGINAGLALLTDARSVLVLNPDVVLERDAITSMLAVFDNPSVGVVVPQTRGSEGQLGFNQRRDPTLLRILASTLLGANRASRWPKLSEVVADHEDYMHTVDIDWGVGAVMLISRECLDLVGTWDESFFLYSEEIDYCQRVRRAGLLVRYTPSAIVHHEGGGGANNTRLRSMMSVNKVRLYSRYHNRVASWAYFTAVLLYETTRGLAGSAPARAAARSLVRPSSRPPEIQCCESLLPS